jgi:hypothetical protein
VTLTRKQRSGWLKQHRINWASGPEGDEFLSELRLNDDAAFAAAKRGDIRIRAWVLINFQTKFVPEPILDVMGITLWA